LEVEWGNLLKLREIDGMTPHQKEPSDELVYSIILFEVETLRFLIQALAHYRVKGAIRID
jgi:hypothetical protein